MKAAGYSVLIVDDSSSMRTVLRRVIKLSGFPAADVLEATNGAEALEVVKSKWVDLVLTDVNMPVMNGIEFIRQMRLHPGLSRIPAVVVSTDGSEARRKDAAELGVRGYLRKPIQPENLRAVLEDALRG